MAVIVLSSAGRRALEALVARPRDVRQYRRAQALLWLAEGERPTAVAQRLRVHRDTIYAWATRYRGRGRQRVAGRLLDRARAGRPRQLAVRVETILVTVLETEPCRRRAIGRPSGRRRYCANICASIRALAVSEVTVRRGLHRLGYRWKRPRYILARRSPCWRQAKGGSNAA